MKLLITGIIAFCFIQISYGQKKECGCKSDTSLEIRTYCKTIRLKNGSKLYYQFNCDSVWLTLENTKGVKRILYSETDTILFQYTYRIGYQFAKEYRNCLLFRSGCPANGPCNFVLVNKKTGRDIADLGELIYDHDTEKFYDFVIYFSNENLNSITLYYIDTHKKYRIPLIPIMPDAVVPEYMFDTVVVKNKHLILSYKYKHKNKWVTHNFVADLVKYHA